MARILAVDDDVIILKVVEATLRKEGHIVVTAKDGHDALQITAQENFDLVVVDANVPGGVSGFQLASTLRKNPRFTTVPIMFLTGRKEKKDVERAIESGADDYMVKPLDQLIFAAKIETLLQSKPGPSSLTKTPLRAEGSWQVSLEVVALSEVGITLVTPMPLVIDSKLEIQSDLFKKIGIATPQLRVVDLKMIEGQKKFSVELSFIGLSEVDHQKIRQWLMSNHPRVKQAS